MDTSDDNGFQNTSLMDNILLEFLIQFSKSTWTLWGHLPSFMKHEQYIGVNGL